MVLSDIDIDIPINLLFPGAHTPAAQPTARARAMLTRALVLRAVLFCAALRRAALAEGWGGPRWLADPSRSQVAIGGHRAPGAPAAAVKSGAIARGRGWGRLPGRSQPRAMSESRGRGTGRAPGAVRAAY